MHNIVEVKRTVHRHDFPIGDPPKDCVQLHFATATARSSTSHYCAHLSSASSFFLFCASCLQPDERHSRRQSRITVSRFSRFCCPPLIQAKIPSLSKRQHLSFSIVDGHGYPSRSNQCRRLVCVKKERASTEIVARQTRPSLFYLGISHNIPSYDKHGHTFLSS